MTCDTTGGKTWHETSSAIQQRRHMVSSILRSTRALDHQKRPSIVSKETYMRRFIHPEVHTCAAYVGILYHASMPRTHHCESWIWCFFVEFLFFWHSPVRSLNLRYAGSVFSLSPASSGSSSFGISPPWPFSSFSWYSEGGFRVESLALVWVQGWGFS